MTWYIILRKYYVIVIFSIDGCTRSRAREYDQKKSCCKFILHEKDTTLDRVYYRVSNIASTIKPNTSITK